jgi:hypothetical protein
MSHEDFAAYMGEGKAIAGHSTTLIQGFNALHILEVDQTMEIPLVFETDEEFESRVERVVAAVMNWEMGQRSAA